tara:strand:- start:2013 stop:2342 length:330 start_codon:yes stop_codon:yes gene_type:complete
MKRTITEFDFIAGFRGEYEDSFTYEGMKALYEYFTELEEGADFEMEYDPIAIHCEYTEYADFTEFLGDYKDYAEEHNIKEIDDIAEHTQLIYATSSEASSVKSFIIQQF